MEKGAPAVVAYLHPVPDARAVRPADVGGCHGASGLGGFGGPLDLATCMQYLREAEGIPAGWSAHSREFAQLHAEVAEHVKLLSNKLVVDVDRMGFGDPTEAPIDCRLWHELLLVDRPAPGCGRVAVRPASRYCPHNPREVSKELISAAYGQGASPAFR